MDMLKFLIFIYLDHLCLPGLLQTLLMGCWWATFFVMPTDEWATITVESTNGIPSQSSLLTGYLHCWAYIWATYTVHTVQPTERLPSLSRLLMDLLHCRANWWALGNLLSRAYWWATLSSLLIGYPHCQTYWWTTFSVEPAEGLPSQLSLLIYSWPTFPAEPSDGQPTLWSLLI